MRNLRAFATFAALLGGTGTLVFGCGSSDEKAKPIDPFAQGGSSGSSEDASAGTSGGGSAGMSGTSGTGGGSDSGDTDGSDAEADAGDAMVMLPAHCSNTMQDIDEGETDIDCGGPCAGCETGQFCEIANDCVSLRCDPTTKRCLAATCTDGTKNGDETDRDCGGSCPACNDGQDCALPSDCKSGVCLGTPLTCQVPTCTDMVRNGMESDIDCGEACPNACGRGQMCGKDADCETNECNTSAGQCECPQGMVIMTKPGVLGGNYCIDEHEVTYGEYNQFWQASVSVDTQGSECRPWNDTFTPSQDWPPLPVDTSFPVAYVDWCDAKAYCAWAGKRLCGAIDGGGSVPPADINNKDVSQWYNACSAQGQNEYPYGATFDSTRCNGPLYACLFDAEGGPACNGTLDNIFNKETLPAHRNTSITPSPCWQNRVECVNFCQGGATGLLDMSGNVEEWTDSCNGTAGMSDTCQARGGRYDSDSAGLECDADVTYTRDTQRKDLGFRCCLD